MAANTRLRGDDGGAAQVVAGRPLRVTGTPQVGPAHVRRRTGPRSTQR
jgi:hypothetical protein